MLKLPRLSLKEAAQSGKQLKLSLPVFKTKQKECMDASSNVAVTRGKTKESLSIKVLFASVPKAKMMESEVGEGRRFRVVLIKEGMGNFRDSFFYTAEALEKAVGIFEGKQCYANHPSRTEEDERPERDVRDIVGHFENCTYKESAKGCQLEADLVVMPGPDFEWVVSMLIHDLDFQKKHPDKEFVGLSINAYGQSEPMEIQEVMKKVRSPEILKKLTEAYENGINKVKMVQELTDAVSCDLVTKAGAGGKILRTA